MEKFFLRFFPEEKQKAIEFANSLPEHKINMARLQEHLMQNRDSAEKALEKSRKVLKQVDEVAEMTIAEWLFRLNMTKHIQQFTKQRILFVGQIHPHVDPRSGGLDGKFKFKEDEAAH